MYLIDISKIYRLICPSTDVERLYARCLERYMKEWDRHASNRQDISWKNNSGSKMTQIMISAVKSAAQCNRESISMGKEGPSGQPILAGNLWAQPNAGKKPGMWGGWRKSKGCSACSRIQESPVWLEWEGQRYMLDGRDGCGQGDKITQGFWVIVEIFNFLFFFKKYF